MNEIAMWARTLETVQQTLARLRCLWKSLAGLGGLLDSCLRSRHSRAGGNPGNSVFYKT